MKLHRLVLTNYRGITHREIEFPDRGDPMVQKLLSGKPDDANPDYDKPGFEAALAERFEIVRTEPVSQTRTLYEACPRG